MEKGAVLSTHNFNLCDVSNLSVKPTRLRRAAYFNSLDGFMLVDWVLPISLYLIFFFPMMRFLTKCITKYRGRNEIPDDWKVPITGIYSGALVYAYQESGATSGWLAVGLFAASVAIEKIIQFYWGPKVSSNPPI